MMKKKKRRREKKITSPSSCEPVLFLVRIEFQKTMILPRLL